MSSLVGTWEMIRAEQNGQASPDLVALAVELEFTADTYIVRFAGKEADRGNLSVTENSLTLTGTEGPNVGRTIPCLYQQAGNRLRVCYGLDGKAPASFIPKIGLPSYLATYRRKASTFPQPDGLTKKAVESDQKLSPKSHK
jgi:uncharacterized protein (TIGR03067 family)